MQPEIKLLLLDVDGTLLEEGARDASDEDKRAIAQARKKGVKIALATGRIYSTAQNLCNSLRIEGPCITVNGAVLRDARKSYLAQNMDFDDASALLDAYEEIGVYFYIFSGDRIYCSQKDVCPELFEKWEKGSGIIPYTVKKDREDLMNAAAVNGVQKIMILPASCTSEKLWETGIPFSNRLAVVRGEGDDIEFTRAGVDKASAMGTLCDYYGIQKAQVMAIGDGGNDARMLREAGVGVAMRNAMESAKQAADYVTADVSESGVAKAVRKFILHE